MNINNPIRKAMRDGYGEAIVELAKRNKDIVALTGDLAGSLKLDEFKLRFPDRFFEIGIAEQNMMGIAAGLASTGKIPFVSSFAMFVAGRSWEQLRTAVCYANFNVKIIGSHAGLSNSRDGASHQNLEDFAALRAIPNLIIIAPCDYNETKKAVHEAARIKGPVYIRFNRSETPILTEEKGRFRVGRAETLREGNDLAIISCGAMVYESLVAAQELAKKGIHARVINMHTIKPIDKEAIILAAKETKKIVTVEEHQVNGGLGGAVAEVLSQNSPARLKIIGVKDRFGQSGALGDVMKEYGLTSESIIKEIHDFYWK
ncbi:transketolase [Candidatus Woesearchaeota archaeon CG10_big_fil_rev_8_21_14_0_10_44_13]|nr:MAG: transketolase [Candidatus Woesearchaeota archaeon CG10_big_fil_rev_8_21_14_0_10_44_13]